MLSGAWIILTSFILDTTPFQDSALRVNPCSSTAGRYASFVPERSRCQINGKVADAIAGMTALTVVDFCVRTSSAAEMAEIMAVRIRVFCFMRIGTSMILTPV